MWSKECSEYPRLHAVNSETPCLLVLPVDMTCLQFVKAWPKSSPASWALTDTAGSSFAPGTVAPVTAPGMAYLGLSENLSAFHG